MRKKPIAIVFLTLAALITFTTCSVDEFEVTNYTPFAWVVGKGTIMHSVDAGQTWEPRISNGGTISATMNVNSVVFLNTIVGYFASGVILSTDNAYDVELSYNEPYYNDFISLACFNVNHYCFITRHGIKVKKGINVNSISYNGSIYLQVTLNYINSPDSVRAFIVGENGLILRSEDQGEHWVQEPSSSASSLQHISFNSNDDGSMNGWVAGANGTILCNDHLSAGWTPVNSGVTDSLTCVHFVSPSLGYITGSNGTLLKTENGGTTWTKLECPTTNRLNSVSFMNESIGVVVGANGIVLNTIDGGRTWSKQTISDGRHLLGVTYCKRKLY